MNRSRVSQLDTPAALALRTSELCKTYGNGPAVVRALRGVTLDITRGELIVLLGPSGSGKSTLLNILGGIDTATSGQAFYEDEELTSMTRRQLTAYRRHHVGFIFQFYNLMPSLTALENVDLVAEIADDPMPSIEALTLVGLKDRASHYPSELSGGEQQRVAIARAIAKRPHVLFCDEPTGALDSKTGIEVLRVLKKLNEEFSTTVLIVTHAAATAAMADRIINFSDGAIREIVINETKADPSEIRW